MIAADARIDAWLAELANGGEIGRLLRAPLDEQQSVGYMHTLREIAQQPITWQETADILATRRAAIEAAMLAAGVFDGRGSILLTGSGSSLFVGACLAGPLQERLGVDVRAVPSGSLLTQPGESLLASGSFLMVSFARSGNSPESCAALDLVLELYPRGAQLVFTCNRDGALATAYPKDPRVTRVVLGDATNDRSLVMTSSFTNLVLAGRSLDPARGASKGGSVVDSLADAARNILQKNGDALAAVGRATAPQVVYLGSGCRTAAAREAALKMLEMTGGRTTTMAESYLGLRHGPMSALRADTLLVAFLSSDPVVRSFELDLLDELSRKGLCRARVVAGGGLDVAISTAEDRVMIEYGLDHADRDLPLLDALVGQLLAFFRCLSHRLRPDAPSDGIINRVVEPFVIHRRRPS